MRNYRYEILANSAFQAEYFTNLSSMRDAFEKSGDLEAAIKIIMIGGCVKDYLNRINSF